MADSSNDVQSREPADKILRGLETTSDKIRALAHAGYLRTEIREILDIRYQHVRKVLVDAGITGGLQRTVEMERSTDVIEAQPAERKQMPLSVLLAAGFQPLGVWQIVGDNLELSAKAPVDAGV